MSDPSTPSLNARASPLPSLHHHLHRPPTPLLIPSSSTTCHNPPSPSSSSPLTREYRKGNWTVHETLILITAKRLNDERRSSSRSSIDSKQEQQPCRSAELRWKWVENYCWRNGCLRSQNQCNDKWDNLLRDYKKVRDYESRLPSESPSSYWTMEKHERKDRNLPSNLTSEVYHALTDVLSRRNAQKSAAHQHHQQQQQHPTISPRPSPSATPLLPPPHLHSPFPVAAEPPPPPPAPLPRLRLPSESTGAETSAKSELQGDQEERKASEQNPKRRKKARDLGSSVARGASVLSRTLLTCEEMREKRHNDLVELEARRLRIEEDRTEVSRQGIAGLIAAVNGLSGAIHALVSDRQSQHRRRNDEC